MSRQSALEQSMADNHALYYPHPNQRYSTSSIDSVDDSALPSPTSTDTTGTVESELLKVDDQTAEDIRLAMTSPLLSTTLENISQVSLLLPPSPKSLKAARSLTELNKLASLVLTKDKTEMELDTETDTTSIAPSLIAGSSTDVISASTPSLSSQPKSILTRPARAQSCGSKRPLQTVGLGSEGDEEKRRKVDEAMVLQEAVSTGVIQPPSSLDRMTHSTPELGSNQPGSASEGALFGHVVKTSDTHPIIISPFFPADLLPLLASHLVPPTPGAGKPVQLRSDIDVPALLLSHAHSSSTGGTVVPSPISGSFPPFLRESSSSSSESSSTSSRSWGLTMPKLGNLLLSSCPGKRLRMDGPVKGRGPVCRDIKTDLKRIKAEGVGCLVWSVLLLLN